MTKTLIAASALALSFGTAASAFELGNSWALDSTVSATYDVENESLSTGFETELNYTFPNTMVMYASTSFDLQDPDFTYLDVGLRYEFGNPDVTLDAWVSLDDNLEYENAFVGVTWDF